MAQAQHNIGNAYRAQGNWPQAESCFRATLVLYEQAHSRLYLAVASMDLGNIYLQQAKPDQAELLYRQACE